MQETEHQSERQKREGKKKILGKRKVERVKERGNGSLQSHYERKEDRNMGIAGKRISGLAKAWLLPRQNLIWVVQYSALLYSTVAYSS